tara:strand:- start:218 stop:2992 length:2775 start_codon:yes stop_codon:yes gene_type:complete
MRKIDTSYDETNDEGEFRLSRLRLVLQACSQKQGLENLCTFDNDTSFAARLGPLSRPAEPRALRDLMNVRERVQQSVLTRHYSGTTPCISRMQSTAHILTIRQADELSMIERCACIPVKNQDVVVLPGKEPVTVQPVLVAVTWAKNTFPASRYSPRMVLKRTGDTSLSIVFHNISGAHCELNVTDLPQDALTHLFEKTTESPSPILIPEIPAPNTVPERLQMNLAAFFQNRMRASVLVSSTAPEGVSRPLCFDSMKLQRVVKGATIGMCIRATLHPTSTRCLCAAHNLDPINMRFPKLRFSGRSYVVLTIRMCGRQLNGDDECDLHRNHTVRNKFSPGVCCAQCKADFNCYHDAAMGDETKSVNGIWINVPLEGTSAAWKELTMILAAISNYERLSHDFRGEPARVALAVNTAVNNLEEQIQRFEQDALIKGSGSKSRPKRAIEQLDAIALRMLCDGGIVQAKRKPEADTRRLVRADQRELDKLQKEVVSSHWWLFPATGQPFQTREQAVRKLEKRCVSPSLQPSMQLVRAKRERESGGSSSSGVGGGAATAVSKGSDLLSLSAAEGARPFKDARYDTGSLVEYIDVRGMAECRRQITELAKQPSLTEGELRRIDMFVRWLDVMDQECGPPKDGPLGYEVRPLQCDYRSRNGGGRIYACGMQMVDAGKGKAKTVCIQGAPRELRPFMCCRFAHDFDLKNCQPIILYQLPRRLTWTDKRNPPDTTELKKWCDNRPEWIEHVAECHSLPSDESKFPEYRKDTVKELMIRLMFGGSYDAWMREYSSDIQTKRRSSRVQKLAQELSELRKAVFESVEWIPFVRKDRERLQREGNRETQDDIDKSVFARIAQSLENQVLFSMRSYLKEQGWTVLTLCFDGFIVQHRPDRNPDLAGMNARIKLDTKFDLEVVEKPLFSSEFPTLSLARAK